MVSSKKGFVDKNGIFRSYKEIITAAKQQVSDDETKGVPSADWVVQLSNLSVKDKAELERIIELKKTPTVVDALDNDSDSVNVSSGLLTPVENASEAPSRPNSGMTFNDVLYGRTGDDAGEPATQLVSDVDKATPPPADTASGVAPHVLVTGGASGGKTVTLKPEGTNVLIEEAPVKTDTAVAVDEDTDDTVYPITIFKKAPRNFGSGSSWFATVYLFFSLTTLGTLFFVLNQLATNLKFDISFTNVGEKLFLFVSILGLVSVILGVIGFVRAKKDGFSKKLSIIGTSISVITFVGLFILFNNVLPLLTYPGL